MFRILVLALLGASIGCESKRDDHADHERYTRKELVALDEAIAQRKVTAIAVGCASVTSSIDALPALRADIEQRCYVAAPRIYLEDAIRDVKKGLASGMSAELACMQLFVGDAFAAMAKRPTVDAPLQALVDEYARLCPAQAARRRQQP